MACKLEQPIADAVWPALLACKDYLQSAAADEASCVYFSRSPDAWQFSPARPAADVVLAVPLLAAAEAASTELVQFGFEQFRAGANPFADDALDPQTRTFFRIYLPLLIGGFRARRAGSVCVTAHIAQTLDGRIACSNGHSQWISNQANLFHAHRLRALHDAVMVGGHTVRADNPQLTVRHVSGDDPSRVLLSASGSVLDLDPGLHVFQGAGSTVICRRDRLAERHLNGTFPGLKPDPTRDATGAARPPSGPPPADPVSSLVGSRSGHGQNDSRDPPVAGGGPKGLQIVGAAAGQDGLIEPVEIGRLLAQRGLHSIFLEGGSGLLSSFLQHRMIDVLHVHVAPMILGSGINSFSLPEVTHVRDGRQFKMEHFEMDGELLFECRGVCQGTADEAAP